VNYRIRAASSDDSKQLTALVEQLGYRADERFIRDQLAQLASRAENAVFVADDNGAIIGLLCFSIIPLLHVSGGLGRISALVVDSQCAKGRASVDVWWPRLKNLVGTTVAHESRSRAATIGQMPTPFTRRLVTSKTAEDS
jgi:hypothetical protein